MQGRASNFEEVLTKFRKNLRNASYVAVDLELTGSSLEAEPDSYRDDAAKRLSKLCRVAEQYVPIQMGFTIVSLDEEKRLRCTSYNFYAFPWVGPELLAGQPTFSCQASALQFNGNNHVDFNAWIREGVPYMSREEEAKYLACPASKGDADLPKKLGLLRLWKCLCEAKMPLVVHTPVDIFFLLSCFEQRNLPHDRPKEIALLLRRCAPHVFDTAALHGLLGGFKNLALSKFLVEAKARHTKEVETGSASLCRLDLEETTRQRYGGSAKAHEAGFDSLLTAQLFAYLIAIKPELLHIGANRLFLFKSVECLDLRQAAETGDCSASAFDLSRETLLVAVVGAQEKVADIQRRLVECGTEYRRMDSSHFLVVIRGAENLAQVTAQLQRIPDISRWLPLSTWRADPECELSGRRPSLVPAEHGAGASDSPAPVAALVALDEEASSALAAAASTAPAAPLSAGSEEAVLNHRFRGTLKTFNAKQGFGFIACDETYARYSRDVFVHHSQLNNFSVGQEVSFFITLNNRGQPQAKDVEVVNADTSDLPPTRTPSSARGSDAASEDALLALRASAAAERVLNGASVTGRPQSQQQTQLGRRLLGQLAGESQGG